MARKTANLRKSFVKTLARVSGRGGLVVLGIGRVSSHTREKIEKVFNRANAAVSWIFAGDADGKKEALECIDRMHDAAYIVHGRPVLERLKATDPKAMTRAELVKALAVLEPFTGPATA